MRSCRLFADWFDLDSARGWDWSTDSDGISIQYVFPPVVSDSSEAVKPLLSRKSSPPKNQRHSWMGTS